MWQVRAEVSANPEGAIKVAERYNEKLERRVNGWNRLYSGAVLATFASPITGLVNYWIVNDGEKGVLAGAFTAILGGSIALYSSWRMRANRKQLYRNYKEMFGLEVKGDVNLESVRHKPASVEETVEA